MIILFKLILLYYLIGIFLLIKRKIIREKSIREILKKIK